MDEDFFKSTYFLTHFHSLWFQIIEQI